MLDYSASMPKFRCEHCRQKIGAPDTHIGRRVRCPRCKQIVRVPEAPAEPQAQNPPVSAPEPPTIDRKHEPIYTGSAPAAPPEHAVLHSGRHADTGNVFTGRREGDFSALFGDRDSRPAGGSARKPVRSQTADPPPAPPEESPPVVESLLSEQDAIEQTTAEPDAASTPHEQVEHSDFEQQEDEAPPLPRQVIVEPVEVIEAPAPAVERAMDSSKEVADLLRTFDQPQAVATIPAAPPARKRGRRSDARRPVAVRFLGILSLLAGAFAIAACFIPALALYAVAAGTTGLLLALTGVVLAAAKRSGGILLPAAGATLSAGAIALFMLAMHGVIDLGLPAATNSPKATTLVTIDPNHPAALPGDGYVPATSLIVVGDVQLHIDSILILQPAVYTGDLSSLHPLQDRKLQLTLELKDLGGKPVTYKPWRRTDGAGDEPVLMDGDGTGLVLNTLPGKPDAPATLAVGAVAGPTNFGHDDPPIEDVLLFDPPGDANKDMKLDLPGSNIGAPHVVLHIRIPAAMVRSQ